METCILISNNPIIKEITIIIILKKSIRDEVDNDGINVTGEEKAKRRERKGKERRRVPRTTAD
jgi:hypothetical protein